MKRIIKIMKVKKKKKNVFKLLLIIIKCNQKKGIFNKIGKTIFFGLFLILNPTLCLANIALK